MSSVAGARSDVQAESPTAPDPLPVTDPDPDLADREAHWAARVAAAGIIGFSLAWVAVALLAEQGLYGQPSRTLEVNLLTGIYYPKFYSNYQYARELPWVAVVLGRNLILIAISLYLVARLVPRDKARETAAGATVPAPA